jgi:hypothetical protein
MSLMKKPMGNAMTDAARQADFLEYACSRLQSAGLEYSVVKVDPAERNAFGDTFAIFLVNEFLLRLVRDRGQVFADVAAVEKPDRYFQLDDLDVALDIVDFHHVATRNEPEDVDSVLARVKSLHALYSAALGPLEYENTARAVSAVSRRRASLIMSGPAQD